MGNFLQKAPAARPASPPHTYALASTPLEELADSAHEQSMSAHTMQSTLRLLIGAWPTTVSYTHLTLPTKA